MKKINRVILIVLDSVGIGALPDAGKYGDSGANTLVHIGEAIGGLKLPNMEELGLGKIEEIPGIDGGLAARGSYGKMAEASPGKDTTTGHWELAGIILDRPFPTYPEGFPAEVIEEFKKAIGRDILGNKPASGTAIIDELGGEHMATGKPIVYTSADSVFQIAVHEEIIPVGELYDICQKARELLQGEHAVGRVIARPFIGSPGNFKRTENRADFSLEPTGITMLDRIIAGGQSVYAVGKISAIFADKGISRSWHTVDNMETVDAALEALEELEEGLLFVNLVEFDMVHGHRRNVEGYTRALEDFDERIPEILASLGRDDLLVITADHGCDPTYKGTDHTREYVPLLIYGDRVKEDHNLGIRETFADLAATITELLEVEPVLFGQSFAGEILKGSGRGRPV
ncbi:MAG: phosphopentomutase, partial [Halanaerobiales bacterium]